MTLEFLTQWWNLVFITPFLIALLYLGLYIATGMSFGHDADGDAGDGDAGHDIEADADADADGDHGDAHHGDAHHGHAQHGAPHSNLAGVLMGFLGVGKLPISFLLMILFLAWGVIGFGLNNILYPKLKAGDMLSLLPSITLPLAGFGAILATSGLARMASKLMPAGDSKALRKHELLGLVGKAVLPIGDEFGMAQVRDAKGDLYEIPCRMAKGAAPVDKGASVRLVGYNANLRLFFVEASE